MTCTVTGNIIDIQAQPSPGASLVFQPSQKDIGRSGISAVVPGKATATTDESGDFTIALLPGVYTVSATKGGHASVQITVPDTAGANLSDIMSLTPPPTLTDAEQAVLAAQGWASKAYLAANAPRDQELDGGGFSGRHYAEVNAEIEQTIAGHVTAVDEDRQAIVDLEQTIAGHAQSVTDDRAAIEQTEQTIAGHVTAVDEDRQAIVDLEQTIAGHAQSVTDDRAAIEQTEQTIAGHVTAVDEDRQAIVDLEQTISGHAQTATDKASEASASATDAANAAAGIALPMAQMLTALANNTTRIIDAHGFE